MRAGLPIIQDSDGRPSASAGRKPDWLKIRAPGGETYRGVKSHGRHLATVCEEARCPNQGECWGEGTATFMLMGDTCTRACRFCAVKTRKQPPPLNTEEPKELTTAIQAMGLKYVVLTSVDRDDLEDGGADHLARCVEAVRESCPEVLVELLAPDFSANAASIERVLEAPLAVFAHNIEVVERLTPSVRDARASYAQSLWVLEEAKRLAPDLLTKSSIMVGMGETALEVRATMEALADAGVDILTLGQYLQPSSSHHPVIEYVHPKLFARYASWARGLGFAYVASGPLVRSSYRAGELFVAHKLGHRSVA